MRKYLLLSLMALLPMTALITVTSCSGDDEVVQPPVNNNANNDKDSSSGNNGENLDIHVIVNDDGTTSNGSIFSAIDNQNFYVDYIKYTVTEGHLAVSGYDKTGFKGIAKIISKLTYKGNTYEVLEIGYRAFDDSSLTSIIIPSSVTSIGSGAFENCSSSLASIIINSGNTVYDSRNNCNAIIGTATNTLIAGCKNTIIPNSVTSIGDYAFYKCSSLTSVTIPNSVTSIGSSAFRDCTSLTAVTIPNSVTSIGSGAFYDCRSLTSITIPNSVTSIGSGAFYDCRSLTSITIPNSVTRISNDAFLGCTSLTAVHINDIAAWCKIMYYGIYYYRGGSVNPLYYAKHLYLNGEELKDLTIPNSVTSIGDYAFMGCSGLTSVTIPNSVTRIGEYAFYECSSLTSITIGSGVTSIGEYAFSYCQSLTDVYCYAENVPSPYSDAFRDSSISSATLHVPAGSIEAYRTTDPWSSFGSIVAIE